MAVTAGSSARLDRWNENIIVYALYVCPLWHFAGACCETRNATQRNVISCTTLNIRIDLRFRIQSVKHETYARS